MTPSMLMIPRAAIRLYEGKTNDRSHYASYYPGRKMHPLQSPDAIERSDMALERLHESRLRTAQWNRQRNAERRNGDVTIMAPFVSPARSGSGSGYGGYSQTRSPSSVYGVRRRSSNDETPMFGRPKTNLFGEDGEVGLWEQFGQKEFSTLGDFEQDVYKKLLDHKLSALEMGHEADIAAEVTEEEHLWAAAEAARDREWEVVDMEWDAQKAVEIRELEAKIKKDAEAEKRQWERRGLFMTEALQGAHAQYLRTQKQIELGQKRMGPDAIAKRDAARKKLTAAITASDMTEPQRLKAMLEAKMEEYQAYEAAEKVPLEERGKTLDEISGLHTRYIDEETGAEFKEPGPGRFQVTLSTDENGRPEKKAIQGAPNRTRTAAKEDDAPKTPEEHEEAAMEKWRESKDNDIDMVKKQEAWMKAHTRTTKVQGKDEFDQPTETEKTTFYNDNWEEIPEQEFLQLAGELFPTENAPKPNFYEMTGPNPSQEKLRAAGLLPPETPMPSPSDAAPAQPTTPAPVETPAQPIEGELLQGAPDPGAWPPPELAPGKPPAPGTPEPPKVKEARKTLKKSGYSGSWSPSAIRTQATPEEKREAREIVDTWERTGMLPEQVRAMTSAASLDRRVPNLGKVGAEDADRIYAELPSGAIFIDPQGRRRQKP